MQPSGLQMIDVDDICQTIEKHDFVKTWIHSIDCQTKYPPKNTDNGINMLSYFCEDVELAANKDTVDNFEKLLLCTDDYCSKYSSISHISNSTESCQNLDDAFDILFAEDSINDDKMWSNIDYMSEDSVQ
ncbi:hypothetical protein GJ496_007649 [Pomphorhynchus laevis]|nr:hypothetical protein GJ496_007649 [Pomphorhynchus laevis]